MITGSAGCTNVFVRERVLASFWVLKFLKAWLKKELKSELNVDLKVDLKVYLKSEVLKIREEVVDLCWSGYFENLCFDNSCSKLKWCRFLILRLHYNSQTLDYYDRHFFGFLFELAWAAMMSTQYPPCSSTKTVSRSWYTHTIHTSCCYFQFTFQENNYCKACFDCLKSKKKESRYVHAGFTSILESHYLTNTNATETPLSQSS